MIRWLLLADRPGLDLQRFIAGPAEAAAGARYRHPDRHRQWLLGRAAAKLLLWRQRRELGLTEARPQAIRILRAPAGWPRPLDAAGRPLPISLSIAHCAGAALCAVAPAAAGRLGADIEPAARRSRAFIRTWFSAAEQRQLAALAEPERARRATLLWCIKEAVLKAERTGLHADTRSVAVAPLPPAPAPDGGWQAAGACSASGPAAVRWRLDPNSGLLLALARLPARASSLAPAPCRLAG